LKVNDSAGHDVKLQADVDSEIMIRKFLGSASNFEVIGEEQGGNPALLERKDPFWVVDPLDGTYNYLRGIPICCVSIALMRGKEPILGAIHDFNRSETFSGGPSLGMRINGRRHSPRYATELAQASLQTGFTTSQDY